MSEEQNPTTEEQVVREEEEAIEDATQVAEAIVESQVNEAENAEVVDNEETEDVEQTDVNISSDGANLPIDATTQSGGQEIEEDQGLRRRHVQPVQEGYSSGSDSEKSDSTQLQGNADGERFLLPPTNNPLTIHPISDWTTFDYLKNLAGLNIFLLFFNLPGWFFAVWFLFWRFAYNVGLGVVLSRQSKSQIITRFVKSVTPPTHPLHHITKAWIKIGMPTGYNPSTYPAAFNAWIGFRNVVDIVLANDLISYIVFCLAYFEIPDGISFQIVFSYIIGIFLCVFTLWAKTDAYRVVKDFAWYWGDFFFLVEQKLTFDRVFSISPHPMYTIGYAFYYGAALISQSSTVLYVSLFAHFCQMLFLTVVENPHIEKTYPDMVEDPEHVKARQTIMSKYFRRDLILIKNFFFLRAADIFTLIIVLFTIIFNLSNLPSWFYIGMVIFWRSIHSFVLGFVLHLQSKRNWWNNTFLQRGESKQQAFENWKSIYNLTLVMSHVAFTCCFFKEVNFEDVFTTSGFLFRPAVAMLMIMVNVWSSVSTYEVLGEFGWFYGDFFIDEVPSAVYYTGIYRFINNPEFITGFAAYYGLAVLSDSWTVYALALFCQIANYLFVQKVERPHMRKLYGNKLRQKSGASAAIQEIMGEVVLKSPPLKKVAESVSELNARAELKVKEGFEKVSVLRQKAVYKAEELKFKAGELSTKVKEEFKVVKEKVELEELKKKLMNVGGKQPQQQ